jgi:chitinase
MLIVILFASAGYISNYELNVIKTGDPLVSGNRSVVQYKDEGDIMIYDGNQWVSYLTGDEYNSRVSKWQGLGFGGTSDWAADLDADYGSNGNSSADNGDQDANIIPICPWTKSFATLSDLNTAAPGMSMVCVEWFALDVMLKMVDDAQSRYNDINNGYDDKFNAYIRYIKAMIPVAIDQLMQYDSVTKKSYEGLVCMSHYIPALNIFPMRCVTVTLTVYVLRVRLRI